VRKAKDGTVSYAIGLRTLETKGEEQVVFASSEAGRNGPRLLVTMAPAASAIPPWAVAAGIVAAAVIAFAIGILLGRRRRSTTVTPSAPQAVPLARATSTAESAPSVEEQDVVECPTCRRKIPAEAEICPRCGARIAEPSIR
jgi:hypothetical protein